MTDTELQRNCIGHMYTHSHTCARVCAKHIQLHTVKNTITFVDFRWYINNEMEAQHRANPKTRIERFVNADYLRRVSRGKGKERYGRFFSSRCTASYVTFRLDG